MLRLKKNRFCNRRTGVLALGVATLFGAGCHRHHGWGPGPEKKAAMLTEHVSDELELNKYQQVAARQIADDLMALVLKFKGDRREDLSKILTMLEGEGLDAKELEAMYKKRIEILNQAVPGLIRKIAALENGLSAGQKKDMIAHLRDRIEDMDD